MKDIKYIDNYVYLQNERPEATNQIFHHLKTQSRVYSNSSYSIEDYKVRIEDTLTAYRNSQFEKEGQILKYY